MQLRDEAELDQVLASGTVLFAIEIPAGFERALRRGDDPALLVAADATDPVATGPAIAALSAVRRDRARQRPLASRRAASRRSRSAPSALQPRGLDAA